MEDRGSLFGRMAGGSDDHRFLVLGRSLCDAERGGMKTEIDHHIGTADHSVDIIAEIHLSDDVEAGILRRETDNGLPHPAFGAGDDEFDLVHRWLTSLSRPPARLVFSRLR